MKRLISLALLLPLLALLMIPLRSGLGTPIPEHEHLRFKNTFRSPEEVVKYYCGRDASGFVWSGLLDSERRNFTLWKDQPAQDSFLIARKYDVLPAELNREHDEATVEVRYELTGIGDAFGTVVPPGSRELKVKFRLQKSDGLWKISEPEGSTLSPVVLESKFNLAGTR